MDEIEIIIEPVVTNVVIEVAEAGGGAALEARVAELEEFKQNGTINGGIIF